MQINCTIANPRLGQLSELHIWKTSLSASLVSKEISAKRKTKMVPVLSTNESDAGLKLFERFQPVNNDGLKKLKKVVQKRKKVVGKAKKVVQKG
jgi:hypothetical protein